MSVTVEDFEDSSLVIDFNTTLGPAWTRTSSFADTGTWSFRSGVIGHNEASETAFSFSVASGATAELSLRYRTDSESNFDKLFVHLDDVERLAASGQPGSFSTLTLSGIAAGTHSVRLKYAKDGSASVGTDAAYVDNIQLTDGTFVVPGATVALLAQQAVEVLVSPDPDPQLAQVAVEALILQHVSAQLAQSAVEVMTKDNPVTTQDLAPGEATIRVTLAGGLAHDLSATAQLAVTASARLDSDLYATGNLTVTPTADELRLGSPLGEAAAAITLTAPAPALELGTQLTGDATIAVRLDPATLQNGVVLTAHPVTIRLGVEGSVPLAASLAGEAVLGLAVAGEFVLGQELRGTAALAVTSRGALIVYPETPSGFFLMF